jgi:hypothetical protein
LAGVQQKGERQAGARTDGMALLELRDLLISPAMKALRSCPDRLDIAVGSSRRNPISMACCIKERSALRSAFALAGVLARMVMSLTMCSRWSVAALLSPRGSPFLSTSRQNRSMTPRRTGCVLGASDLKAIEL